MPFLLQHKSYNSKSVSLHFERQVTVPWWFTCKKWETIRKVQKPDLLKKRSGQRPRFLKRWDITNKLLWIPCLKNTCLCTHIYTYTHTLQMKYIWTIHKYITDHYIQWCLIMFNNVCLFWRIKKMLIKSLKVKSTSNLTLHNNENCFCLLFRGKCFLFILFSQQKA